MDRRSITSTVLVLVCAIGLLPQRVPALTAAAVSRAAVRCVGDCDSGGSVTVDELVTGVNIALGSLPLDRCPSFDCTGDGAVTVNCLITAVVAALNGCAPAATLSATVAATATVTPTPASADQFVDNGDGTISDTQTGLIWEKKDQSGGVHDVDSFFPWTGVCTDQQGVPCNGVIGCTFCQPDAAAEGTCTAATGGAEGCARCPGAAICQPINGLTTVWQWLNQINGACFAGHNDWRIPTIGRDGGAPQLETIVDTSVAGCGSGPPCIAPAFDTGCVEGCVASDCSCTDIGEYWSATPLAEVVPLPSVWSVLFFRGTIGGADKTSGFFARAVRSPPCGTFLATFGSQGSGDGQLSGPVGVAVDAQGDVLVADRFNNRVQKFTSSGSFVTKWGSAGQGDGQFANPVGVAVDADMNVYVADFFNDRIQKFTSSGAFLGKWGSTGSGAAQFIGARAVAVTAGGVALAIDDGNDRVEAFTASGEFLTTWGSPGNHDGQLNSATALAVAPNGSVWVTDENPRVQRFACSAPPQ